MPQLIAHRRQAVVRAPVSAAGPSAPRYARHVPEGTMLYGLVRANCPDFLERLERLCRHIARPAISERRLSLSPQGRVRYALKTPWSNGTTHVEFEPVDFIGKLAALVPPPRAHLTRFHGIFAPNAVLRAQLTPSGRGKGATTAARPRRPAHAR